ncbi:MULTISPECIES: hypothetical protein [Protofrankia]|uniref:hypothetical protein n=1 Tax=Protofrankia TaxID=2994361 RepID=UPI00031AFA7D|nr:MULTISPECIES: hypothetical protein [Protofrankia]
MSGSKPRSPPGGATGGGVARDGDGGGGTGGGPAGPVPGEPFTPVRGGVRPFINCGSPVVPAHRPGSCRGCTVYEVSLVYEVPFEGSLPDSTGSGGG